MSRFLLDITSWYWWASVVVVGIVVNLASAYLKTPIDRLAARWSAKRSSALAVRESQLRQQAEVIARSPGLLALEIRNEALGILMSVLSLALLAANLGVVALMRSAFPESPLPIKIVIAAILALAMGLIVLTLRGMTLAFRHTSRLVYVRQILRRREAI